MSLFIETFQRIAIVLTSLTFLIFIILQVPCLLISLFFRFLVWLSAKLFHPELDSLLTNTAAVFALSPLTEAQNGVNIFNGGYADGELTKERVQQLFVENLLQKRNKNGKMVYKRLQQTWTTYLGYAFWKKDQNFSLSNHIRQYDYKDSLALPDPCHLCDIEQVLGKFLDLPWTNHQSPWEILVIPNFVPENGCERKTFFLGRFNHVLGDGYSVLELMKSLIGAEFRMPAIKFNQDQFSFWQKMGLLFKVPYDLSKDYLTSTKDHSYTQSLLKDSTSVSISPIIPVSLIKQIKTHYKVSYAAVLHSAVQGAIVTSMKSAGVNQIPENVLCHIPVPLPNHPGGTAIHFMMVTAKLQCEASNPVERLYKIHAKFNSVRYSSSALGIHYLIGLMTYYPYVIWKFCFMFAPLNTFCYAFSTFPSTVSVDYVDDLEIMDIIPGVKANKSIGISVCSGGTNNKQRFCFVISKEYMGSESIERNLSSFFVQELQALAEGTI